MQPFEPGPYEEFVGKLSSIRVSPEPKIWLKISNQLERTDSRRKRFFYWQLAVAASFLLTISIGLTYFLLNQPYQETFAANYFISSNLQPLQNIPKITKANLTNLQEVSHSYNPTEMDNQVPLNIIASGHEHSEIVEGSHILNELPQIQFTNQRGMKDIFVINRLDELHEEYAALKKGKIQVSKNTNTSRPKNRWSVTAFVNPSYSYHTSAVLNRTTYPREDGVWMLAGEIQLKRQVNKRISFISGVTINPTGQYIKDLVLLQTGTVSKNFEYLFASTSYGQVNLESTRVGIANANNLSNTPKDILKSASISTAVLRQQFYHIELPLILSTNLSQNKVGVELKIGTSVGVLVDNWFEVISSRGTFFGKTDGVRRYSLAALGAITFSIPVASKVNLVVEPNLRLGLFSIDRSNLASSFPFNASVRFGVGYKF